MWSVAGKYVRIVVALVRSVGVGYASITRGSVCAVIRSYVASVLAPCVLSVNTATVFVHTKIVPRVTDVVGAPFVPSVQRHVVPSVLAVGHK